MPSREDRFVGSLWSLALGDAIGARYEGGLAARWVWSVLRNVSMEMRHLS